MIQQVARETMLALLGPSEVESCSAPMIVAPLHHESTFDQSYAPQGLSGFDEFGNDETELLRQTVLDLRQQVAMLQSENQKLRRGKVGK